jgi:hypothetical protein
MSARRLLSSSRVRLVAVAGVAAACAVPALVSAPGSGVAAATPNTIGVPAKPGVTVTHSWSGTIAPGADADNDCTGSNLADSHAFKVTVPRDAYDSVIATMVVSIVWQPTLRSNTSDEILSLVGPDGTTIGSSDGSSPKEQVTLDNPAPGTYTALACGFANIQPQPYKGSATITTVKRLHYPNGKTHGLRFSATVPSDPQRSEGEPAITTDLAGNMYTCGPTGSSQMNDYAQVSTDGGDQFHLLGTPPRGQIGHVQAGGDCALATAKRKNEQGHYQLAYSGLGPLTGFSTATSADTGRRLVGSPDSESIPAVDRQWIAFSDAKTAFLNYNHQLLGQVVQKSTDGGLTYGPPVTAATDGGRIGQIRVIPKWITGTKPYVYFPYDSGTQVKIALSKDGGDTWSQCVAVDAQASPTAGFPSADNDRQGNVYVSYAELGAGRDTYLVAAKFKDFKHCAGSDDDSARNDKNPGFTKKIRINRGDIETTVMPWVIASGKAGRAAVAFYGTNAEGNPDSGEFHASWYVWVSQLTDVFDRNPNVGQVRASTHPFHYDSICLGGLGCDISGGDRSLVDYFTMDYDPKRGGLVIVYSQANKRPGDVEGNVSIPAVVTQIDGPSNGGGTMHRAGRQPLRTGSPDPAGDAISRYSVTNLAVDLRGPGSIKVPALDLVDRNGAKAVTIGKRKGGGFKVTMRFKDLSDSALQQALSATSAGQPGSLLYLFRFYSGYRPVAAVAKYDANQGFRFGFSEFDSPAGPCGAAASTAEPGSVKGKCLTYAGDDAPLSGRVDKQSNSITLSVPASYLKGLGNGLRHGKPYPGLVKATKGTRMYDGTAFTFVNDSPRPEVQTWMQQVDNAPAFDFLLPSGSATSGSSAISPAASIGSGGGLPAAPLGAAAATALVLAMVGFGAAGVRRRTRSAAATAAG